jgi:hypothetical protein
LGDDIADRDRPFWTAAAARSTRIVASGATSGEENGGKQKAAQVPGQWKGNHGFRQFRLTLRIASPGPPWSGEDEWKPVARLTFDKSVDAFDERAG